MELNVNGIDFIIKGELYLDNYFNEAHYFANAIDKETKEDVVLCWDFTEEWKEAHRIYSESNGSEFPDILNDTSNACDWNVAREITRE